MKTLFTALALLCANILFAQDTPSATVAPSVTSLQLNLGALHLVHERGVSDDMTIRMELGVHQQFRFVSPETTPRSSYYGLRPVLGLAGRYYYNLAKRAERGRITTNNSGNFIGLLAQYRPDFFVYTTNDRINPVHHVRATAYWGIRRQLGKRFDMEVTAGINLQPGGRLLGRRSIVGGGLPHLDWRLGYRF